MNVHSAIALATLVACSAPPSQSTPRESHVVSDTWAGSFSPAPKADDDVVAEVNGERIYASDVARQAAARGQSPRQALDELTDAELLAQEARRRGLVDQAEVVEARKKERVRRLIEAEFEPSFDGPEDVPQEDVDKTWSHPNIQPYFNHEEYRNIVYVRLSLKMGLVDDAVRKAAEALRAALVAAHPANADEFEKAARAEADRAGVGIIVAKLPTTRHHSPTDEAFASAAYTTHAPGDITPPVRSSWGWDILFLESILPERHTSKAEAEPEIRANRFEAARRDAFIRWANRLAGGSRISRNDSWLARIAVDSAVALP